MIRSTVTPSRFVAETTLVDKHGRGKTQKQNIDVSAEDHVGALPATSAGLFTALKWIGDAHLIWLGVSCGAPAAPSKRSCAQTESKAANMLWHACQSAMNFGPTICGVQF